MTVLPLYVVDAFTSTRFAGNPAAVCLLQHPLDDAILQSIAAEENLSETAFLEHVAGRRWKLRWFTPKREVPLCGHATVASAAALLEGEGIAAEGDLEFETRVSGVLLVRRTNDGLYHLSAAKSDHTDAVPAHAHPQSPLLQALLGPERQALVESVHYNARLQRLMVVLKEGTPETELLAVSPDIAAMLAASTDRSIRGISITMAAGPSSEYDVAQRFFAPWSGIDEDPVTGSVCISAGPFWAARLGRAQFCVRQCSARGGDATVTVDAAAGRVDVAGAAVLVSKGVLYLD